MNPNHLIENCLAGLLPTFTCQMEKLKPAVRRHFLPTARRLRILLAVCKSVSNAGAVNAHSFPRRQSHAHP